MHDHQYLHIVRQYVQRTLRRQHPRSRTPVKKTHYKANKERARTELTARVEYWNQFYNYEYKRIAIRNQRKRWGSCSSLGNLNFNYKLIYLPDPLQDYVVVHELCHLRELNHSSRFWAEVARSIPHYQEYIVALRHIEATFGTSIHGLTTAQVHYRADAIRPARPDCGVVTTAR